MSYITIASTGNATSFGTLTYSIGSSAATSSAVRGVTAGGVNSSFAEINTAQYITISSTGNSTFFGNLTQARRDLGAVASGHGGL